MEDGDRDFYPCNFLHHFFPAGTMSEKKNTQSQTKHGKNEEKEKRIQENFIPIKETVISGNKRNPLTMTEKKNRTAI